MTQIKVTLPIRKVTQGAVHYQLIDRVGQPISDLYVRKHALIPDAQPRAASGWADNYYALQWQSLNTAPSWAATSLGSPRASSKAHSSMATTMRRTVGFCADLIG